MGPIFRTKDNYEDNSEAQDAINEADYIIRNPPGRCTGSEIAALLRAKTKLVDAPSGSAASFDALKSLKEHLANYDDVK